MKQFGITLIELLIGISIFGIGLLGISSLLYNTNLFTQNIKKSSWINQVRSEVIKSLKSESGWRNTVNDSQNSDIACLRNKFANPNSVVNCPQEGGVLQVVRDPSNALVLNSSGAWGFDKMGNPCQTFGSDQECIFKLVLNWKPKCQNDKCLNPDFIVEGKLNVSPKNSDPLAFNPEFYSFNIHLSHAETKEAACQLTGLGEVVNEQCRVKIKFVKCENAGEYLVGFNRDGTPRCAPRNLPSCNGSGFIYGVTNSGGALCDPRTCL